MLTAEVGNSGIFYHALFAYFARFRDFKSLKYRLNLRNFFNLWQSGFSYSGN